MKSVNWCLRILRLLVGNLRDSLTVHMKITHICILYIYIYIYIYKCYLPVMLIHVRCSKMFIVYKTIVFVQLMSFVSARNNYPIINYTSLLYMLLDIVLYSFVASRELG